MAYSSKRTRQEIATQENTTRLRQSCQVDPVPRLCDATKKRSLRIKPYQSHFLIDKPIYNVLRRSDDFSKTVLGKNKRTISKRQPDVALR